jgi:uncharacterized protein
MTEEDIVNLIKNDKWMMDILRDAQGLHLPDWMIGAGFLRNKVWDYLHNMAREVPDTRDIDLVYFNAQDASVEKDKKLSRRMSGVSDLEWDIKNQAYMHLRHGREKPYKNTVDALSEWVETATCVAVNLKHDEPKIVAPYGIDDLVNLVIRPVPTQRKNLEVFYKRIESKQWLQKWHKLRVVVD